MCAWLTLFSCVVFYHTFLFSIFQNYSRFLSVIQYFCFFNWYFFFHWILAWKLEWDLSSGSYATIVRSAQSESQVQNFFQKIICLMEEQKFHVVDICFHNNTLSRYFWMVKALIVMIITISLEKICMIRKLFCLKKIIPVESLKYL